MNITTDTLVLATLPFCYPSYRFGFLIGILQHIPFYIGIAIFVYSWVTCRNELSAFVFRFYVLWWSLVVYALQWGIKQERPFPECVQLDFLRWGMPCSETFYVFLICSIILLYYRVFDCAPKLSSICFGVCLPLLTFWGVVASGLNSYAQALTGALFGVLVAFLFCGLAYYVVAPLSPKFTRYCRFFGDRWCIVDTIWYPQWLLCNPCHAGAHP